MTCVAMSLWLSRYIPGSLFDNYIVPYFIICTTTVCFGGAWLIFRHSEGLRIRKAWGCTLVAWGVVDAAYLLFWLFAPAQFMNMTAYWLTRYELVICNWLGWLLLLYPTEALRPGWLNLKRALWQLLPLCALCALDYVVPVNLGLIISLYPFVLAALLITHMRAYRIWCEENYSTLDDIDVQWIMRYLIMLLMLGVGFLYICLTHDYTRAFTQRWLMLLLMSYSTEQILFRRDPWQLLHQSGKDNLAEPDSACPVDEMEEVATTNEAYTAYRETLEHWMEREKPYVNPDFRLIDLRQVLPLNRTYLSQFIHVEYGCTFYQFVNRYRIEEAKRLKLENPDLKASEISKLCGFSSPTVFSRTFTNITGITPREWSKKIHSA
jgi:AraC-like DNA-binding protein